ncbi:hypothetical protein [Algoriphagus sp. Y33]|uniref:hypothetical protein n=1 Tax=Algoriphagus sp. Y33 TaxID=2772483 RepID=UPI001786FFD2|nr:hypothetical protein [Algoriphagus sp. Y33]
MTTALQYLIWFLFYFSLASLIVGLIRPVFVLWFMDRMNRRKVLKFYGAASVLFLFIGVLAKYYFN